MALILSSSIFYHIPKTGGSWVNSILRSSGLVKEEYRQPGERWPLNLVEEHVSPQRAREEVVKNLPSFAFVRSPITWYQSFWRYKHSSTWDDPYKKYESDNFNKFMTKIMDITPGFLTQMYKEFDSVTYMGKQENLRNDLASTLSAIGEEIHERAIFDSERVNSTAVTSVADYDSKVLKRMKKLERWVFEKYYPEDL